MVVIALASKGYGSINEIEQLDSKQILDIIEYEIIKNSIGSNAIERAKDGHS